MLKKHYYLKLFLNLYRKFVKSIILKKKESNNIYVTIESTGLYGITKNLKNNSLTQLKLLNDICIVDYPEKTNRFELTYNLLSIKYNIRVFLKTYTPAYIASLSPIFNSSN